MSNYELQLEPVRMNHNPITGKFLKGHLNVNKGKTWDEFMPKRAKRKCRKGWKNLDIYRDKALQNRSPMAGSPKRKVIAVSKDGRWTCFESIRRAEEIIGCSRGAIQNVCRKNQKRKVVHSTNGKPTGKVNTDYSRGGIRFYFEDDPIWMTKIKRD